MKGGKVAERDDGPEQGFGEGPPSGPEKSPLGAGAGLFEAVLLYSAFWLRALFPWSPAAVGPADPAWHFAGLLGLLPAGTLVLWVMRRGDGFGAFSLEPKPRPKPPTKPRATSWRT